MGNNGEYKEKVNRYRVVVYKEKDGNSMDRQSNIRKSIEKSSSRQTTDEVHKLTTECFGSYTEKLMTRKRLLA